MKVEVKIIYLPITESMNLSLYDILNRHASNNTVKVLAETLIEKYDVMPDIQGVEKVLFTLTAKEENIMDIAKTYIPS